MYRLIDPEQYQGKHVLVVGGGDAALEAAVAISEQPGATVTLSYRGNAFNRVKPKNRERMEKATTLGQLRLLLESNVKQILDSAVALERDGRLYQLNNDAVIVNAGGVLPSDFLRRVGISVEAKFGTA